MPTPNFDFNIIIKLMHINEYELLWAILLLIPNSCLVENAELTSTVLRNRLSEKLVFIKSNALFIKNKH